MTRIGLRAFFIALLGTGFAAAGLPSVRLAEKGAAKDVIAAARYDLDDAERVDKLISDLIYAARTY